MGVGSGRSLTSQELESGVVSLRALPYCHSFWYKFDVHVQGAHTGLFAFTDEE